MRVFIIEKARESLQDGKEGRPRVTVNGHRSRRVTRLRRSKRSDDEDVLRVHTDFFNFFFFRRYKFCKFIEASEGVLKGVQLLPENIFNDGVIHFFY